MNSEKRILTEQQQAQMLQLLKNRFEMNMNRHEGILWSDVEARLKTNQAALWSLFMMEQTGGEPDVILLEQAPGTLVFCDCSEESPPGRRSLCYDQQALESRKKNKPVNSALALASEIGIDILTEKQYRQLQSLGSFDSKTSSWVKTPDAIRRLGGALFCDRRYDTVFVYHNGAESYYSSRGFRGLLCI